MASVHRLKWHRSVNSKSISTLLAAILILGQLGLVQHALDLSSHASDEHCELCLLSTSLDHGLALTHHPINIRQIHHRAGNQQDLLNTQSVATAFLARAPPELLFI